MKREIILEQEETEFLEESEQYLEGYKTTITVQISFIETEELKELKTLQTEEIEIIEDIKDLKKELLKYEEKQSIEETKDIKDLKRVIKNLYSELGTDNLKKAKVENEKEYNLVIQIKDKEKKLLKLEEEKIEEIKIYKEKVRKNILNINETIEELNQLLKKNRLRQEELTEKINAVKEKTTEEIYLDLINNTTYKVISDREIAEDGKFYAKSQHFIMLNESGNWLENNKAFKDFNSIEALSEFMNIPLEKNFKMLSIQNNNRSKKYIATIDNIPNIKEIEIIEATSKLYEEQLEKIVILKDNCLKVENIVDRKIEEYKTFEKTIKRNINNSISSFNDLFKDIKEKTTEKIDNAITTMKNKLSNIFSNNKNEKKEKTSFFDKFKGNKK